MQPDITVFGHKYRAGKMGAIPQFHVMRRLHGVAASAGETLDAIQRMGGAANLEEAIREKRPTENVMKVIAPILRALGEMRDEDVDYVLNNCLAVVQRAETNDRGWSPVMPQPGVLMFQDIQMPCMLVLTWHVLRSNLGNFFSDLLAGLSDPGTGSASDS